MLISLQKPTAGLRPADRDEGRRLAVTRTAPRDELQLLLHTAALLDLRDLAGWAGLRDAARDVIQALVSSGVVPPHLGVGAGDPPVVIARLLGVAARYAAMPAPRPDPDARRALGQREPRGGPGDPTH